MMFEVWYPVSGNRLKWSRLELCYNFKSTYTITEADLNLSQLPETHYNKFRWILLIYNKFLQSNKLQPDGTSKYYWICCQGNWLDKTNLCNFSSSIIFVSSFGRFNSLILLRKLFKVSLGFFTEFRMHFKSRIWPSLNFFKSATKVWPLFEKGLKRHWIILGTLIQCKTDYLDVK